MEKQRKRLQDYAREYYAMGNECITQARDARAALANYPPLRHCGERIEP